MHRFRNVITMHKMCFFLKLLPSGKENKNTSCAHALHSKSTFYSLGHSDRFQTDLKILSGERVDSRKVIDYSYFFYLSLHGKCREALAMVMVTEKSLPTPKHVVKETYAIAGKKAPYCVYTSNTLQ